MKAVAEGHKPIVLLTMLNEQGKLSRSHAIPEPILEKQARLMGLPMVAKPASWENYESVFIDALHELKTKFDINAGVFGDIDLKEHRDWEEKVCGVAGLETLLPLWKQNRKTLVLAMLEAGMEARIVSCNESMGEKFLGEQITPSVIAALEKIGVDPCGENGEYHTLVVNAPVFESKLDVVFGVKSYSKNYWFIKMELI